MYHEKNWAWWVGGYRMHKPLATTKKHSPAAGHNHKKSSQTKKIQFRPRLSAPGLIYCFLGVWGIHKSLGSNILGRNWKSMWKPCTGSIFDFLQKKILLVIFKTLFTANHPFLDKFSPNLFLVKSPKSIYKFFSKINLELNFDHFWLKTYCDLTKKQASVKIAHKWMICSKQSLKND